ncbi:MAG: DNA-directed RNA polymerase subunit omega [Gammaproteobacteria bacterium]|nr:DNA-directed RNA polymerase subunit omega [Gammaproteobacteria bacterium]
MARVTIEDCLKQMNDRFKIVLAASSRAKEIKLGASSKLEPENDKATVIALREIAAGIDVSQKATPIIDAHDDSQEFNSSEE